MKTIKDITVKMTFRVGLGNVKVPDKVYDALAQCYDEGGDVPMPDECTISGREDLAEAAEWLSDNIKPGDAMDWEFEIEDFDE